MTNEQVARRIDVATGRLSDLSEFLTRAGLDNECYHVEDLALRLTGVAAALRSTGGYRRIVRRTQAK